MGCQTVFVSRKDSIRSGPGTVAQSVAAGRTTRLRLSAPATCSSVTASTGAPARSIALTSMCDASHGATSAVRPVSTLTTPPGTSDVARTSESVTAGSGRSSLASTTATLPVTTTGARTDTRPRSDESCGARTVSLKVASSTEKSKYGPATGLV